jgi:hypothetical protein
MVRDETASPAAALRTLRPGDSWSYSVAGSLVSPDGGTLPLTGKIEVSIVPDELPGRAVQLAIQFSQNFEVLQPDSGRKALSAPTWMFSIVQNGDTADVAITADNMGPGGARRTAKAPQVFYPGRWSGATAYENQLDFDNGDYVKNTLAVIGQEWVETARGRFLAWKSTIASDSVAMGRIEGMDWWMPELGAPVRFSTDAGMPDGSRIRFLATLSDTNVLTG